MAGNKNKRGNGLINFGQRERHLYNISFQSNGRFFQSTIESGGKKSGEEKERPGRAIDQQEMDIPVNQMGGHTRVGNESSENKQSNTILI